MAQQTKGLLMALADFCKRESKANLETSAHFFRLNMSNTAMYYNGQADAYDVAAEGIRNIINELGGEMVEGQGDIPAKV